MILNTSIKINAYILKSENIKHKRDHDNNYSEYSKQ